MVQTMNSTLAGWSNLTEAIKNKAAIDWEALDGIPAKCVHPEKGFLQYALFLDETADDLSLWSNWFHLDAYDGATCANSKSAWHGEYGWTFYVKGEIPLKTKFKTADQLEPGTCFIGTLNVPVSSCD